MLVRYDEKAHKVVIEIDVSEAALKNARLSATQKTKIVDTLGAFSPVAGAPGGLKVQCTATIPNK